MVVTAVEIFAVALIRMYVISSIIQIIIIADKCFPVQIDNRRLHHYHCYTHDSKRKTWNVRKITLSHQQKKIILELSFSLILKDYCTSVQITVKLHTNFQSSLLLVWYFRTSICRQNVVAIFSE